MPQPKGKTGNPNGRPKGTPNKLTTTVRSWLVELVNNNREQIEQDFKNLEGKDRLDMLQKLLPYLLPKVSNDWEVKGACYDSEDIEPERARDIWKEAMGVQMLPAKVKRWYEREGEVDVDTPPQGGSLFDE